MKGDFSANGESSLAMPPDQGRRVNNIVPGAGHCGDFPATLEEDPLFSGGLGLKILELFQNYVIKK